VKLLSVCRCIKLWLVPLQKDKYYLKLTNTEGVVKHIRTLKTMTIKETVYVTRIVPVL